MLNCLLQDMYQTFQIYHGQLWLNIGKILKSIRINPKKRRNNRYCLLMEMQGMPLPYGSVRTHTKGGSEIDMIGSEGVKVKEIKNPPIDAYMHK